MDKKGPFLHKTVLLFVFAFLLVISCRKNEPKDIVVLYCSVDQVIAEPIIAEFERRNGIKVLARFDTEAAKTVGLVQKIRAESGRPVADVFWSNEIFHTIRLKREGMLAPFKDEQTRNWSGPADANGCWYGFALRARVIAYNSQKITASDAPKSLEQLLETR